MSKSDHSQERIFHGVPVSAGIAVGPVFVHWVDEEDIPEEVSRFEAALIATRAELLDIQQRIAHSLGAKDAGIFDAHLLVVEDRTLIDEVLRNLKRDRHNVEAVFHQVAERYRKSLSEIDDDYLRERALDIEDVARRIIHHLLGKSARAHFGQDRSYVIASTNLTPSDTALLDRELVKGFVTEVGSRTSHTAIMARSMGIPAIVGLRGICEELTTGDTVLIDGYSGEFVLHPSEETLKRYGEIALRKEEVEERLELIRDTTSTTRDGRHIVLSANMDLPDEISDILESGAEGVGLYRTEFLYLNRETPPSEEEQYENYRMVAEGLTPHGVIIRTLDIGGDKAASSLHIPPENNPFLGCRAIRYCMEHPDIFKTQLRAILRASVYGKIRLMYPLISGLEELRRANHFLEECKQELRDEGKKFNESLEVGIMIEVPSAALTAHLLAPEVQFFSIGTNDLIQYTLALDRVNEHVAHLYDPTHPAVITLIHKVVQAGQKAGIWVGLCGEIAGDISLTPLLVGIGLDELSTGSGLVPRVKKAVQSLDTPTCRALVEEALEKEDSAFLLSRSQEIAKEYYGELLD